MNRPTVILSQHPDLPRLCPACGARCDAATQVRTPDADGRDPKTGDATICAYCASALVFTDGGLRVMTPAERDAFLAEPLHRVLVSQIALRVAVGKAPQ